MVPQGGDAVNRCGRVGACRSRSWATLHGVTALRRPHRLRLAVSARTWPAGSVGSRWAPGVALAGAALGSMVVAGGPASADAPATYPAGSVVVVRASLSGDATVLRTVDVSGLDRPTAQSTVGRQAAAFTARRLTLTVPRAGASDVVVHVVASRLGAAVPTIDLPAPAAGRLSATVTLSLSAGKVRSLLDRAAAKARLRAVDATVHLSGSGVSVDPGHPGTSLDEAHSAKVVLGAVTSGRASLPTTTTAPRFGDRTLARILVVHTATNTLDFYVRGHGTQVFTVATGSPGYPSPHGLFHVVDRQPAPSWYNPHDDWSRNLPDVIGPGPDNPLGTRALALDSPGILIHGIPTGENASIGSNASHGCVRMRRAEVERLFPEVPLGTPVLLTS